MTQVHPSHGWKCFSDQNPSKPPQHLSTSTPSLAASPCQPQPTAMWVSACPITRVLGLQTPLPLLIWKMTSELYPLPYPGCAMLAASHPASARAGKQWQAARGACAGGTGSLSSSTGSTGRHSQGVCTCEGRGPAPRRADTARGCRGPGKPDPPGLSLFQRQEPELSPDVAVRLRG